MDELRYALVNEDNRVLSVLDVPYKESVRWTFPDDRWKLVLTDFEFDPIRDYADYIYDEENGTFMLTMPLENFLEDVQNVLENGEPKQKALLESLLRGMVVEQIELAGKSRALEG